MVAADPSEMLTVALHDHCAGHNPRSDYVPVSDSDATANGQATGNEATTLDCTGVWANEISRATFAFEKRL